MRFAGRGRVAVVLRACAPIVVAAATVAVLLQFPPGQSRFYPRCPVYALLHLRCPGCGATRALAALLHGQIAEAWHQNALFILLLPIGLHYGAGFYGNWLRGERAIRAQPSRAVMIGSFAAAAAFMMIRNLWQVGI